MYIQSYDELIVVNSDKIKDIKFIRFETAVGVWISNFDLAEILNVS